MNINPGELNKRIQIYSKGTGKDADGYPVPTLTLVLSCWAKFSRTSGTETIKSGADFADTKVRFLIRHTSKTLSRKMIVRYAGKDYEIEYLNDYEDKHEYIEIWAAQVTTDG